MLLWEHWALLGRLYWIWTVAHAHILLQINRVHRQTMHGYTKRTSRGRAIRLWFRSYTTEPSVCDYAVLVCVVFLSVFRLTDISHIIRAPPGGHACTRWGDASSCASGFCGRAANSIVCGSSKLSVLCIGLIMSRQSQLVSEHSNTRTRSHMSVRIFVRMACECSDRNVRPHVANCIACK